MEGDQKSKPNGWRVICSEREEWRWNHYGYWCLIWEWRKRDREKKKERERLNLMIWILNLNWVRQGNFSFLLPLQSLNTFLLILYSIILYHIRLNDQLISFSFFIYYITFCFKNLTKEDGMEHFDCLFFQGINEKSGTNRDAKGQLTFEVIELRSKRSIVCFSLWFFIFFHIKNWRQWAWLLWGGIKHKEFKLLH